MLNKKNKQKKTPTGSGIKIRAWIVGVLFIFVGFGLVISDLFKLQLIDYDNLKSMAAVQQITDTVIEPDRGNIYDANMNLLAKNISVWDVEIYPNLIQLTDRDLYTHGENYTREQKLDEVSRFLSSLLELDNTKILEKISNENDQYELIKTDVDKGDADIIQEYIDSNKYNFLYLRKSFTRTYPNGDFAAHVLGFVGSDNQGLSGVENYYDEVLTGTPGRKVTMENAKGIDIDYADSVEYPVKNGNSLVLTIDQNIQKILEEELEWAVKTHNVEEKGMGVVLDAKTGEILGLAVENGFDLNEPYKLIEEDDINLLNTITDASLYNSTQSELRQSQWRNKIVSDRYEPGSVFKVITAAAALDYGTTSIYTPYRCSGSITPAKGAHTIGCAEGKVHGNLTVKTALINSCNVALVQIANGLGIDAFYDYFNAFGFTEKTGIDLPGEAVSIYHGANMSVVNLASSSFGQSFKITPIQMVYAFTAAINGGNLLEPHLVNKILDSEGNIIEEIPPTIKRQVISEDVSAIIRGILESNVGDVGGQGGKAYVSGYRVGGKSGTSQKLDKIDPLTGEADENAKIASFASFAPADDPEIVVLVILDEAHSHDIYGSVLAGPVVSNVISRVMPYLEVKPQYTQQELDRVEAKVPSCTGEYFEIVTNAESTIEKLGFNCEIKGTGIKVTAQFPEAGTLLPKDSTVILYTEDITPAMTKMPNLLEQPASKVYNWMKDLNLNVIRVGPAYDNNNVVAISQSIPADTMVEEGSLITVEFADKTIQYG